MSAFDKHTRDEILDEYGPLSLHIPDDVDGSRSFAKMWLMKLAEQFRPCYRFLEQNGFTWRGGVTLEWMEVRDDEVPYVRAE